MKLWRSQWSAMLIAVISVGCVIGDGTARAGSPSPRVVELFTSQGCSSCPPADALLADLARRSDIIALSYNVDYWDYLGWKDTLGQREFSERQRGYARARGDGQIYTPQMVIAGRHHVIGSDAKAVTGILEDEARRTDSDAGPSLSVNRQGETVRVTIGGAEQVGTAAPNGSRATIYNVFIASVAPTVEVAIKRGENSNRTIVYHNVVRDLVPVGVWSGAPATFEVSAQMAIKGKGETCAVLLQRDEAGPIVAAAWLE